MLLMNVDIVLATNVLTFQHTGSSDQYLPADDKQYMGQMVGFTWSDLTLGLPPGTLTILVPRNLTGNKL